MPKASSRLVLSICLGQSLRSLHPGGQAQKLPRARAEVVVFHLGSPTKEYHGTYAPPWNLFSLPEQSQRNRGHVPLKLSLSIQSGFFGLFGGQPRSKARGSCQIYGHFSLALYKFSNCRIWSFIYSLNSYYWESIGLENCWMCKCHKLSEPQFPHLLSQNSAGGGVSSTVLAHHRHWVPISPSPLRT